MKMMVVAMAHMRDMANMVRTHAVEVASVAKVTGAAKVVVAAASHMHSVSAG
jgi:hypothetical protein